jgi:hypothetical protein
VRKCRDTKSTKGCGARKSNVDFKIVRVNKNTGVAYRTRLCTECLNKSRRIKPHQLEHDKESYNQFDALMRG